MSDQTGDEAPTVDPNELRRKRTVRTRRGVGLLILGAVVLTVVGAFLVNYRVSPRDLTLDASPFWLIFAGLTASLVATVTGFALLTTRPHVAEVVSTYDARVRTHVRRARRDSRDGEYERAIRSLETAIALEREKLTYLPGPEELASGENTGRTELVATIDETRSNVERLRTRKADLQRARETDIPGSDGGTGSHETP